jgi:hypothetical protein
MNKKKQSIIEGFTIVSSKTIINLKKKYVIKKKKNQKISKINKHIGLI